MLSKKNFLIIDSNSLPCDVIQDLRELRIDDNKDVYDYNSPYVIIVNFITPKVNTWRCMVSYTYWNAIKEHIKTNEEIGNKINHYFITDVENLK